MSDLTTWLRVQAEIDQAGEMPASAKRHEEAAAGIERLQEQLKTERAERREVINDALAAEGDLERYRAKVKELQAEIAINEKLLVEHNRLLAMFYCPVHGSCVPFAIAEVKELRKRDDERKAVIDDALVADSTWCRAKVKELQNALVGQQARWTEGEKAMLEMAEENGRLQAKVGRLQRKVDIYTERGNLLDRTLAALEKQLDKPLVPAEAAEGGE